MVTTVCKYQFFEHTNRYFGLSGEGFPLPARPFKHIRNSIPRHQGPPHIETNVVTGKRKVRFDHWE